MVNDDEIPGDPRTWVAVGDDPPVPAVVVAALWVAIFAVLVALYLIFG